MLNFRRFTLQNATSTSFGFSNIGRKSAIGSFNGHHVSSDGGALLLKEIENKFGIINRFAKCFKDNRNQNFVEHSLNSILTQRIFGLILGYEDLNDHDQLRYDPLFAAAVGKSDIHGKNRANPDDQGKALAGKSTLNRFELSASKDESDDRYKKFDIDLEEASEILTKVFLEKTKAPPLEIILDIDNTDAKIHGNQEGKHYHSYYDGDCFMPFYVFSGKDLLRATLKTSDIHPMKYVVAEISAVVIKIKEKWPDVKITIRGDSGFCCDELMDYCEKNSIYFLLGLPKNNRLDENVKEELIAVQEEYKKTNEPILKYKEFVHQTLDSWSKPRRVIAKMEQKDKNTYHRFIVTSLPADQIDPKSLYEKIYCPRGEMENRIKEQQLGLFADRMSTHYLKSNQVRLLLSSVAYVFLNLIRERALKGTELASAQSGTIRLKLLKIGVVVTETFRQIRFSFSQSFVYKETFLKVLAYFQGLDEKDTFICS